MVNLYSCFFFARGQLKVKGKESQVFFFLSQLIYSPRILAKRNATFSCLSVASSPLLLLLFLMALDTKRIRRFFFSLLSVVHKYLLRILQFFLDLNLCKLHVSIVSWEP